MAHYHSNLLIGGAVLRDLDLDLEHDRPLPDSTDWVLSGRLSLTPSQNEQLQCGRCYRLQLDDGRAGAIVVSRLAAEASGEVSAEFEPVR